MGLFHIEVVPAADRFALGVFGFHSGRAHQGLVERGQPLLAVEDERLRLCLQGLTSPCKRSRLEADVLTAGLEQHHGAYRKGYRDAREQALDVFVIPHPSTLEVGELQVTRAGAREQILQGGLGAIEAGADH